ncbi:MAG: outer membrane lipoprotein carrier protein LolA, partial [Emcibacteraceae bacterium]|nr:outer membrane lipoprotein carrier protein LolA [Emcibacteraceae bacterium]
LEDRIMNKLLFSIFLLSPFMGVGAIAQVQEETPTQPIQKEDLPAPNVELETGTIQAQPETLMTPEPNARMVEFSAPPSIIENEDRDNILSKIEDTLNRVRTLKATFIQRGPQGNVDEGTIFIERPGKIRFEYTDDTPILVVSNGDMLSFVDYEVNQVSRWPIDKTPLGVLVNDHIDLTDSDIEVPEMIRFAGLIKASVIQPDQKDYGYITLIFEESTMELKSWEVVDVQGYTTRVALLNPEYNVTVDAKNFTYDDPRPRRRGPHR